MNITGLSPSMQQLMVTPFSLNHGKSQPKLKIRTLLLIDILSFIVAVIIGQYLSYRLLIHKQLSPRLEKIALAALLLLAIAFIVFTFIPPHLPPFQDPISGEYGITEHMH